jgi:hypothetical protein
LVGIRQADTRAGKGDLSAARGVFVVERHAEPRGHFHRSACEAGIADFARKRNERRDIGLPMEARVETGDLRMWPLATA